MNMQDRIKRINELYHKSQNEGLTEEEKQEQTRLRKEYVESVRGSLKAQLDNIDIKEADGSITNLGEKFNKAGNISAKADLRKEILSKRSSMKASEVIDKSKIICSKITELDVYKNAKTVLLYYPYNNEAETFMLFDELLSDDKIVAFPKSTVVDGVSGLDFYVITDKSQFENGYKGIMEPDVNNHELEKFFGTADLCIAPGVVFDKKCHRIGYGKGFYDRYLQKNPPLHTIGIAFELQVVEEITPEAGDISMDMVVTEKNIYE